MVYYQKMTPEGYQEIKDEIARLKKDRPRRIKILQEARSMGDLSENSEYTTAKMELGHLQSRLRYLDKQLRYSEIIQKDESGTIDLGSNVKLLFISNQIYSIVMVFSLSSSVNFGKVIVKTPSMSLAEISLESTSGIR